MRNAIFALTLGLYGLVGVCAFTRAGASPGLDGGAQTRSLQCTRAGGKTPSCEKNMSGDAPAMPVADSAIVRHGSPS